MDRNRADKPFTPRLLLRQGTIQILVCAVTMSVYFGTLAFGFVYDDTPQILKNPAIQNWRYLPQYFTSHVWAAIYPNTAGNYYRPLFLLWLRINFARFGANPAGWHAASVVCHIAATCLVFRIARQLTGDQMIASAAALLFGLHPAHVESVAWISGVTDPLMGCFVLGSCSAFLNFRQARRASLLLLSLALFALALLSKETAVVLPPLIFALALTSGEIIRRGNGPQTSYVSLRLAAALRETAPYIALTVIYFAVRYRVLKGLAHPTVSIPWTTVFLTWPSVLWFYAKHLLLPVHLSEFYSLNYVDHATATLLWPLLRLLALAAGLYFLIRVVPQKQVAFFAIALIALPLLPVLDLRSLTARDIAHDRYLYLPSAGFALIVALSIAALKRHLPERLRVIAPAMFICIAALIFARLTLTEQTQWGNDIQLYTRGMQSAPDNLTVRDNLANALLATNQPTRAIPLYEDILQRNPNFWPANYNLGFAYYKMGNYESAEEFLQRAVKIDASDADQYIYLALVELQLKKFAEAGDDARRAIARNPQARGYHYVLGLIENSEGDPKAAAAAFQEELTQHPDNTPAVAELRKLQPAANPH